MSPCVVYNPFKHKRPLQVVSYSRVKCAMQLYAKLYRLRCHHSLEPCISCCKDHARRCLACMQACRHFGHNKAYRNTHEKHTICPCAAATGQDRDAVDLHSNYTAAWRSFGWMPEVFGIGAHGLRIHLQSSLGCRHAGCTSPTRQRGHAHACRVGLFPLWPHRVFMPERKCPA